MFASSSSSDGGEDWVNQLSKGPASSSAVRGGRGGGGGGGGESAMMQARRRALQAQREKEAATQQAALQKQQRESKGKKKPANAPAASGKQPKQESNLPPGLANESSSDGSEEYDDEEEEDQEEEETSSSSASSEPAVAKGRNSRSAKDKKSPETAKKQRAKVSVASPVELAKKRVEELKLELEAKRRVLRAAKEKESALLERLRADKAKKMAEIDKMDREMEKNAQELREEELLLEKEETEFKQTQEKHQQAERSAIEQEVAAEYEPRIAALAEELEKLNDEEKKLRQSVESGESSRDVVTAAVSGAVAQIAKRVQRVYEDEVQNRSAWEEELRDAVRREIESSFAVTVDVEAQAERESYAKAFDEFIEFWKKSEEEQRTHIRTLDELLLLDMQSVVQEDLNRLQREEMTIDETYANLRETWMAQHQEILKKELDLALQRSREEIESQRTAQLQLHTERMHDIEVRHREMLAATQQVHDQEIRILKDKFNNAETLQKERRTLVAAIREDATKATQELTDVTNSLEQVLRSVEAYKDVVEKGNAALDERRGKAVREWKDITEEVKQLVGTQMTNADTERRSLANAAAKLEVVQSSLSAQLDQEAVWVAQQHANYEHTRVAWEKEYRQWQLAVVQERQRAEERFTEALISLQEAGTFLAEEHNQIESESRTMQHAFNSLSERVARESKELEKREEGLLARYDEMNTAISALQRKSQSLAAQWKQLQEQRVALSGKRGGLRNDELQMQSLTTHLDHLRATVDGTRADAAITENQNRQLQQHLENVRDGPLNFHGSSSRHMITHAAGKMSGKWRASSGSRRTSPGKRLPQMVLQEMRNALVGNVSMFLPDPLTIAWTPQQQQQMQTRRIAAPNQRQTREQSEYDNYDQQIDQHQHRQHRSERRPTLNAPTGKERSAPHPDRRRSSEATATTDTGRTSGSQMDLTSNTNNFTDLVTISDMYSSTISSDSSW